MVRQPRRAKLSFQEKESVIQHAAQLYYNGECDFQTAIQESVRTVIRKDRQPAGDIGKSWPWLAPAVRVQVNIMKEVASRSVKSPEEVLSQLSTETVLQEAISRLIQPALDKLKRELTDAVLDIVTTPTAASQQIQTPTAQPSVQRIKPKVCIVGLLPDQQRCIEQEFGDMFAFRFLTTKKGTKTVNTTPCKKSDYTVVMSDFIHHALEDKLKAMSLKWIRVPGGTSALRDQLHGLYKQSLNGHC